MDVVAAASHVEYDNSTTEFDIRSAMALQEYQSRLKHNATTQRKFGKVRPSSKGKPLITKAHLEDLLNRPDAPAYLKTATSRQMTPCSEEVFWKILDDNGIKFMTKVRPTICSIHDKGPGYERELTDALVEEDTLDRAYRHAVGSLDAQKVHIQQQEERTQGQKESDDRALSACTVAVDQAKSELLQVSQKVLELEKKVDTYKKHLAQFETSSWKILVQMRVSFFEIL